VEVLSEVITKASALELPSDPRDTSHADTPCPCTFWARARVNLGTSRPMPTSQAGADRDGVVDVDPAAGPGEPPLGEQAERVRVRTRHLRAVVRRVPGMVLIQQQATALGASTAGVGPCRRAP
jgi:hypothetical protein